MWFLKDRLWNTLFLFNFGILCFCLIEKVISAMLKIKLCSPLLRNARLVCFAVGLLQCYKRLSN